MIVCAHADVHDADCKILINFSPEREFKMDLFHFGARAKQGIYSTMHLYENYVNWSNGGSWAGQDMGNHSQRMRKLDQMK